VTNPPGFKCCFYQFEVLLSVEGGSTFDPWMDRVGGNYVEFSRVVRT
jgi:hypothetical protein